MGYWDPNKGEIPYSAMPSVVATQFGSSTVYFNEEGNFFRAVGNPFSQNQADATLDILAGFAIPAGAFDGQGNRGLAITAQGKFGATVTGNVVISLYVNPTMTNQVLTPALFPNGNTNGGSIITGGQVTGGGSVIGTAAITSGTSLVAGGGWALTSQLFKFGGPGSNTQWAQSAFINSSSSATAPHQGMQAPVFPTANENAIMNIVLAASSSTSTLGETILNFFEINAMN